MTEDKTYTFTRGIDTVHVTIGRRELGRARVRLWLVVGGPGSIVLVLGVVLWPLLVSAPPCSSRWSVGST